MVARVVRSACRPAGRSGPVSGLSFDVARREPLADLSRRAVVADRLFASERIGSFRTDPVFTMLLDVPNRGPYGRGRTAGVSKSFDAAWMRPGATEITVDQNRMSRRSFLAFAMAAPLGASALASCGTAGPGQAASGEASFWFLSGQPQEGIRKATVDAFNDANPDAKLTATTFQNDAYKPKIKTAIGAGQGPTHDLGLGRRRPEELRRRRPGRGPDRLVRRERRGQGPDASRPSFGAATVDGKIYAMPVETVQPIVLYYNKRSSTRSAPSRRSRGATSWTWCRSSTPRASRRSRSAASRAGPT